MKKKFSLKWKSSKQVRKQRKYRANAPLHKRQKMIACPLSNTLREKYKRKSMSIRKGDNVKVMRGEFKKKIGKIAIVNLKKMKVVIEGLQKTKKDGTKVGVLFDASNLQITELNLDDKKRLSRLNSKLKDKKEDRIKENNKEEKK